MKHIRNITVGFIMLLFGCTTQAPISQAPVYNVTVTDNSQYVIGDNNQTESTPTTSAEQVAKPDISAQAKSGGNGIWLFWLGFMLGAAGVIAGYLVYIRYIKKRT